MYVLLDRPNSIKASLEAFASVEFGEDKMRVSKDMMSLFISFFLRDPTKKLVQDPSRLHFPSPTPRPCTPYKHY